MLLLIPTIWSYEEKELINPILPIVLGPTYVTYTHHITYYHINLQQIEKCLNDLEYSITATKSILSENKTKDSFTYLVTEKLNQTHELLESQKLNAKLFYETPRQKRGLINAVGKINKWLFGSLDSDDEQKYDQYLNVISNNQKTLQTEMQHSITILSNVTQIYATHLNKIEENQKIIRNKLALLDAKQITISDTLYISLIIDNINNQLLKIKTILLNIQTAISFARLNIMHNTIINEFQLKELLNNLPKEHTIQFSKIINYYKIMIPQVKITKNKFIIFAIHVPMVHPIQFTMYKILPIPILNQTFLIPKPYVLLTENKHYSTEEECLEIENTFICPQEKLSQEETCIVKILTHNENTCPMVNIHYTTSSITKINAKEILVIPAKPIPIISNCQELKRSALISKPTLITLAKCPLEINGQTYAVEETNDLYYSLEIPKIQIQDENYRPHLKLQEVNNAEIKEANRMVSTIRFHNLQEYGTFTNHWTIPSSIMGLAILTVLLAISWKKIRKFCNQKKRKQANFELQETENRQLPLFSELKEGGVM